MEKWIQNQLFWEQWMFNLVRGIFLFGATAITLFATVIAGAVLVEGFNAPSIFGGDHRLELLGYGLAVLALLTIITKGAPVKAWLALMAIVRERHEDNVAAVYRATRACPEYYSS